MSDPVPWNSRICFTLKLFFAIFDVHVWWDVHLGIHVIITSSASQIMVYFFENIMFTLNFLLVWYLESVTGIFFCLLFSCVWNIFFSFLFIISVKGWLIVATLDDNRPLPGIVLLLLFSASIFIDLAIPYQWSFAYNMKQFVFILLGPKFCYPQ